MAKRLNPVTERTYAAETMYTDLDEAFGNRDCNLTQNIGLTFDSSSPVVNRFGFAQNTLVGKLLNLVLQYGPVFRF